MNIAYLIGNGFDLNIGMRTRYSHFYDYYIKLPSSDPRIKQFKSQLDDDLQKDTADWSDMEIALGRCTVKFESWDDFEVILDDIREKLARYIRKEESNYIYNEEHRKRLYNDLASPESYLPKADEVELSRFLSPWDSSHWDLNIISFNYSSS